MVAGETTFSWNVWAALAKFVKTTTALLWTCSSFGWKSYSVPCLQIFCTAICRASAAPDQIREMRINKSRLKANLLRCQSWTLAELLCRRLASDWSWNARRMFWYLSVFAASRPEKLEFDSLLNAWKGYRDASSCSVFFEFKHTKMAGRTVCRKKKDKWETVIVSRIKPSQRGVRCVW